MRVWFSSDLHLGHDNVIKLSKRPFNSIEEMDETLIHNWNELVKPEDVAYILGDFAWRDVGKYASRLHGNINLVLGNHDKRSQCEGHFCSVHDVMRAKVNGRFIFLSHFSHRVWDKSHYNSWHLFGHNHGRLPPFGKSFDVGVDAHFYQPISFEQVEAAMLTLPDNWNLLKKEDR